MHASAALPSTDWIELGGLRVRLISGGGLRLDGGAMFGIIPRNLWARVIKPDDQNRISLACNCLLVEWDGPGCRRMIVETGHGEKYLDKERGIFAIDPTHWLATSLAECSVDPRSINDVIVTHLHFDHAGGLTRTAGDRLAPTFPAAHVHVQQAEFTDARANFGIMTLTYREENYTAIDAAGLWNPLNGPSLDEFERSIPSHASPSPIAPGVWPVRTPGHTRGHQSVLIVGRDASLLFLGDVMPTRHHLHPPYNMGYDLFPLDNRDTKRRMLTLAARLDWLVAIDHEIEQPIVRVRPERDWFAVEPL
ncbi:MAG: MBL fold metallo-hydrolase [Phycisphaerae bacterium]